MRDRCSHKPSRQAAMGDLEGRFQQRCRGVLEHRHRQEKLCMISHLVDSDLATADLLPDDVAELPGGSGQARGVHAPGRAGARPPRHESPAHTTDGDARIRHQDHRPRSSANKAALSLCLPLLRERRMRSAAARASTILTRAACSRISFSSRCNVRPCRSARPLSASIDPRFKVSHEHIWHHRAPSQL